MTLHDLVKALPRSAVTGTAGDEVRGVQDDSRRIRPGEVFVAVRGEASDGHRFIPAALEAGAVAIVAEEPVRDPLPEGVGWVLVPDTREALAILSANWFGNPSRDLRIAGVTGTNGKTTTAFLLHGVMKKTLYRAGLIGTVIFDDGAQQERATHTTPGTLELQSLLARMRDNGCQGVAMEVSSHGLEQGRVAHVEFEAAIFTNLTQDHLDYHGSMERYFESKRLLFEQVASQGGDRTPSAVINIDDHYGNMLARECAERMKVTSYGFGAQCDFRAGGVRASGHGTAFQLEARGKSYLVRIPLIGRFNVYNALATLATAASLRVPLRDAVAALAEVPQVPGRMELVGSADRISVFVDYAHTPDALENAGRTLRELNPSRLVVVFGCGGDRDRRKRPEMAEAAAKHADQCVITSDNPRSEDPAAIIADAEKGMPGSAYRIIVDRAEAIREVVLEGRPGDVVLIAGKGHEDYQQFADRKVSLDDRKEARAALDERRAGNANTR